MAHKRDSPRVGYSGYRRWGRLRRPVTPALEDEQTAMSAGSPSSELGTVGRSGVGQATANARWSFLGLGIKVLVQAVAAFLIARIVGPSVYGTMSLGLIWVTLTNLLLDQGMGQALIANKEMPRSDVAT